MSGVGEAGLVLGIISSIISVVTAAKELYETANDVNGLPKAFHNVAAELPIILVILKDAKEYTERPDVDHATREAFQKILARCEKSANELHAIFKRVFPKERASSFERYWSAARKLGKGGRVENLIKEIRKEVNLLQVSFSLSKQRRPAKTLEEVFMINPSLPDNFATRVPIRVTPGEGTENSLFKIKTLREIKYLSDQSCLDQSTEQDPKEILSNWLLPEKFPAPNPAAEHASHLRKRFHNPETSYTTCEWFFKTAAYSILVNPETASVLRIKGPPGYGKSVLSSAIIDRIQSNNLGSKSALVLYCYGHRDPEPTSSMALVRVLLAQTLQWETPDIMLELQKFQSRHRILKEYDSKTEEELWSLLRTILALKTEKLHIVIDGLDECAQPLLCVRYLIKVTTVLAATNKCSLLISSRLERRDVFDNKNVQTALRKGCVELSQLEMTPELTRHDLTEFVAHQVTSQSLFISSSQEIRDKIIRDVCGRANGMFLYASLVLEDLRGEKISSISAIDVTLDNLPRDLFNSYKQNLEIPRHSMKGPEAFRWIFCSNPALSWHELKSALAIGTSGYDEKAIIHDGCEAFIEHSCGQLVESFGELERLRFIHPTVKDFLIDSDGLGDDLDIFKAHSMVSSKLLIFLGYPDLPSFSSPNIDNPEEIIKTYSLRTGRGLYSFATFNWYKHLKECDKSENAGLEEQVLEFLMSPNFIRWLKSAIIMSHASRVGGDSVSLTADVIDSLQGWVLERTWSYSDSKLRIQAWIKDFLDLMLDWGKVLEAQPDWIHYLHHQLLSESSYFRKTLEHDGDQSIIQFHAAPMFTKSSEISTWPTRCFAMDVNKDLAFTYDEPFISCYHMKTGLLTAEVFIPIPSKIGGPLVVRRGVLCPQGKYLAIIFEATGPSADPVGAKIRAGRHLCMNLGSTAFAWELENAGVHLNASSFFAHIAFGIGYAEFVVCLLKLQHEGPARTHLFGLPRWATNPVLTTGSTTMRWELDDVDVLHFSDDSSRLATPFGIFNVNSGESVKPWSFALDHLFQGGKITTDFKIFGTVVRDIDGCSTIRLHDVDNTASCRYIELTGIAHLLAISNHGRFLLLVRRQLVKENKNIKGDQKGIPPQQGSIGIWDCRCGKWTPLLLLDQHSSQKLSYWNLHPYMFPPHFAPETEEDNNVNRVLLYAPPKWKLASNVRNIEPFHPMDAHLLLFEAKTSPEGFGKYPSLKLQLPATAFRREGISLDPALTFLSWSPHLDTATIYHDLCIKTMAHAQMRESALTVVKNRKTLTEYDVRNVSNELQEFSVLLASPTGSVAFHIKLSLVPPENENEALIKLPHPTITTSKCRDLNYEISVACLMTGESQATFCTVRHVTFPTIYYPPLDLQYICVADENSISLGCIELDIDHGYEEMSISVRDPNESIFQRALRSFKSRAHPLKAPNLTSTTVEFVEKYPIARYAIFDNTEITFIGSNSSPDETTGSFIANGETTVQDNIHIFQFSRRLVTNATKNRDSEAGQFEVFLCAYDVTRDDISWMMHTTTGGEISRSRDMIPETAWALHPHLPLLAWLLPGHKLRISNLESHEPPITIAESLAIEVDSTNAMKFSPDGRYMVVQAREFFKNDMCSMRNEDVWGVILCDLVAGKVIGATLTSTSNVSIELDNEVFHVYRLTRDGAIESSSYTLPDLVLSERQHLTFVPAHCCCSTCGKSFESQCTVSIMEYYDAKYVVLGHTPISIGRSSISTIACEPLMIRIASPPVELNLVDIQDALLSINSSRLFPMIVSDQGDIHDGAFADLRPACIKESGVECSCAICNTDASPNSISSLFKSITQMQTSILDFQLLSGLSIPLDEIKETHRLSENNLVKALVIPKESEQNAKNQIAHFKTILGDEVCPWDSWDEFRAITEETKELFDSEEYLKRLFEPGKCGVGCQIPLFVHTFNFANNDEKDFRWSSAMAIGWIEEDLEWYYERFFRADFEGARRWYVFPAYQALTVKFEGLISDETSKGKRFRKYFGGKSEQGLVLETPLPQKESEVKLAAQGVDFELLDDIKPMATGLIMKDIFDCMSDMSPGLGKVFEERFHYMLNESLISEEIE